MITCQCLIYEILQMLEENSEEMFQVILKGNKSPNVIAITQETIA